MFWGKTGSWKKPENPILVIYCCRQCCHHFRDTPQHQMKCPKCKSATSLLVDAVQALNAYEDRCCELQGEVDVLTQKASEQAGEIRKLVQLVATNAVEE